MLRLLIFNAPNPAVDLALEEAIQLCVEEKASPNTWRLWQAVQPALILGTGQEHAREANLENVRAENVPLLRRHSGGGAVVIGPGVINYSAFYRFADLPGSETIRGAMYAALKPLTALLESWGLRVKEAGLSDLAVLGADGTLRKIAGNSQARKRRSVVVHGTLLADPDWARMERLLKFPSMPPEYRAGRGHRGFLTSLKECGVPFDFETFAQELAKHLPSDIMVERSPSADELKRAKQLLDEKYSRDEWNLRR
ncbi:MAG TPA: biotin/lipoate A/B protein ligase family protein [Planctomycetota bacterium]|nr:biotin/lipoate A/B protein ligase family protein [Planctomycetota bacterium]